MVLSLCRGQGRQRAGPAPESQCYTGSHPHVSAGFVDGNGGDAAALDWARGKPDEYVAIIGKVKQQRFWVSAPFSQISLAAPLSATRAMLRSGGAVYGRSSVA